jgi:hypothetical protein
MPEEYSNQTLTVMLAELETLRQTDEELRDEINNLAIE